MTMLVIPDIRQTADYDCGDAAVGAVFRFLGLEGTPTLATPEDGTHPSTIESALRRAGLCVQSGNMALADLGHHTELGRPVICPVYLYGGHWVVVRGVTRAYVHYHCPSAGPQKMSRSEWVKNWADGTRYAHDFATWGISVWSPAS